MIKPMLAKGGDDAPMWGLEWAYEPKYDGVRIIAVKTADVVALYARSGNTKTGQFPEIVHELEKLPGNWMLDGEVIEGNSTGNFQNLQSRIHLQNLAKAKKRTTLNYVVFDLIMKDGKSLASEPWMQRRLALETMLPAEGPVRFSRCVLHDATQLYAEAQREKWEGLIAKRVNAPYRMGVRSSDWLKMKFVHRQEFVIGGWTEPRQSRQWFGALIIGYYDKGQLVYAGCSGSGFTQDELTRVAKLLAVRKQTACPFSTMPNTDEAPHWVTPDLVCEVKFSDWTADGHLRWPIYYGMRDDIDPKTVRREPVFFRPRETK